MKIALYGDFITDIYSWASLTRFCPEQADAPIYDLLTDDREFLGCAGNVAANIAAAVRFFDNSSENELTIFGSIGRSTLGKLFRSPIMKNVKLNTENVKCYDNSIVKQRIVLDEKIACRIDSSRYFCGSHDDREVTVGKYDLLIVSDYCFGGVEEKLCRDLINNSEISVVDTKRKDLSFYNGATAFKFNRSEYEKFISGEIIPSDWIVVSKGSHGCSVIESSKRVVRTNMPAWPANEIDVTGCGDTFTSVLGLALAHGKGIEMAAYAANYIASKVVSRFGPAVPTSEELLTALEKGII